MHASLKWIKELLPNLKTSPASIEKRLNAAGLEVEAVTSQAAPLDGVIVGEVRELEPHPDADKLRVAKVFDGETEHTVVCGAPNVRAGQKIAFAPVGLTIPNGITLDRRKIRGVESAGMICSEAELGISDESDGILVTKPRARPGKPIAKVEALDDTIYELGVTPNRPDVLSHHGIAREMAALFGLPLPKVSVRVKESGGDAKARAKVQISDGKRCKKYAGRVLTGVKVGPSPTWVKRRLQVLNIRSISNVVDATNLVLMELGQPLHAFDLAKLSGSKVIVRTSKPGEKIDLLDGSTKTLNDDLVIADTERPIALAGVMGGANSEVSDETVDILLESAFFDAVSVRKTSRRHALHTDASHRFERGVDYDMVEVALDRCAQLIIEFAGGQVLRGRLVDEKSAPKPVVVPIRPERAATLIGRPVDKKEVRATLTALGLRSVKKPSDGKKKSKKKVSKKPRYADAMYFLVPSWRIDLTIEEDLIEEVGRVAGYDAVPTIMPPGSSEVLTHAPARSHEHEVRHRLVAEGFLECISLAFDSDRDAELIGADRSRAVVLSNPLGEETRLMRLSMVSALLRAARLNQDNLPSITDLRLFEVGKTFTWGEPLGELPVESNRIGILIRGRRVPKVWTTGDDLVDAYDLKAVVESVLDHFAIRDARWAPMDVHHLHPRSSTVVEHDKQRLATLGELHPDVAEAYGLDGAPVFVAELHSDALLAAAGAPAKFLALPKLPPAQRDLSFFLSDDVPATEVLRVIRAAAPADLLEDVELFDVYTGRGVPDGQKSLAVAMVFRAPDRTLTDEEVEASQALIVEALTRDLSAEIRAGG